jgi:hypothetical protein
MEDEVAQNIPIILDKFKEPAKVKLQSGIKGMT